MIRKTTDLKTGPQVNAVNKILKINSTSMSGDYALTELPIGYYPLIIDSNHQIAINDNSQLKDFKNSFGMGYLENNDTTNVINSQSGNEWCDANGLYEFAGNHVSFLTTNCTVQLLNNVFNRRPLFVIIPFPGHAIPTSIDTGGIDVRYYGDRGVFTFTMPPKNGTITIYCPREH